jgi:hypothetical protein
MFDPASTDRPDTGKDTQRSPERPVRHRKPRRSFWGLIRYRGAMLPEGMDIAAPAAGSVTLTVPAGPGGRVHVHMTADEAEFVARALAETVRMARRAI